MVGRTRRELRSAGRAAMVGALVVCAGVLACGTILDVDDDPAPVAPDAGGVNGEGGGSDGGADADANVSIGDANAEVGPARPIAFVTTAVSNANFQGAGGANAICVATATDAGLPGSYRAYLQLLGGFDAEKRLVEAGTYYRVDGQPLFDSFPPLDAKLPFLTERGQQLAADAGAWTGIATETCNDWTDLADRCGAGAPSGVAKEWRRVGVQDASVELHVYCFGD